MTVTPAPAGFVAGATGYTGRAVVEELRRRAIPAAAHVRPDSPRLQHWRQQFEALGAIVDDTPWEEDLLAETLGRIAPTMVFALLGTTRGRMKHARGDSYETVDYGLTALLLRAVQRGAPRARFVYLSSLGVGPSARGDYLRLRWRMEQELRASALDWIIARPAFITGPDRAAVRPLERAGAIIIDGALRVASALGATRMRARFGSMTGTGLARGLVRHALDPAGSRRILSADALR